MPGNQENLVKPVEEGKISNFWPLRLVWSHVEVGLKLNSRLIPINPDLFSSMPILLAYQPILCQLENSQNLPRKKKIEILKFFDQL